MLNRFENYRFEGEMQRVALLRLKSSNLVDAAHKSDLTSAYTTGKRLALIIQFPVILSSVYIFSRVVPKYSPEVKMLSYTFAIGFYGMFYMFTKAWAWHHVYQKVEPTVRSYVLSADLSKLKQIFEDQSLGISSDQSIYVPSNKP